MSRTTTCAVMTVAAAVLLAGCHTEGPTAPEPGGVEAAKGGPKSIPVNGRLYFSAYLTGNYELYSMNPDGSDRRRLTWTADRDEVWPDVSPDGKRLAFLSRGATDQDIYTINTDGTGIRRATYFNSDPVAFFSLRGPRWSPDGRKLAFSNVDPVSLQSAIYTVNPTGGQLAIVGDPAVLGSVIDPEYSPDGQTLVFSAWVAGGNTFELRTMPVTGGATTTLGGCGAYCYHPTWDPDGSRILVEASDLHIYMYQFSPSAWSGYFNVDAAEAFGGAVAFAPDGSRLAYTDINQNLVIVNVSGYGKEIIAGSLPIGGMAWGR